MNDLLLLRRFVDEGAQDAFAELARRHTDLVYSAALRQVGGDTHIAEEITQAVFLALAGRARELRTHPSLTGWLYTTTRFVALKALRTQTRWRRHEQEANRMTTPTPTNDPIWAELRPVLDAAMHELGSRERAALLLRFFEGKSLAAIGVELGLAENSARMRVDRALEKLRRRLARRGITSTAAALGVTLSAQSVTVAPPTLAAEIGRRAAATVLASSATGGWLNAFLGLRLVCTQKAIVGTLALAAAFGLGTYFGSTRDDIAAATVRPRGTESSSPQVRPAENTTVNAERAKRDAAIAAASDSSISSPAPKPFELLRIAVELQKLKILSARVPLLDFETGKLSKRFINLFELTSTEQTNLWEIIDRTRLRLAPLERENATASRGTDGSVTITVKSYPRQGGTIYDELMSECKELLGPERQSGFVAIADVEEDLDWLGAAARTIQFSIEKDSKPFKVVRAYETPTRSGSSTRKFETLGEAVAWAGPAGAALPKDFGRPK